jgi:uncharacterized protein (TIGR00255 family)
MRSMTGFGAARTSDGERMYSVEVRAVNHRYCDVHVHVPHDLFGIEGLLEARIRKQLDRGRIDVSLEVSYASEGVAVPRVDLARARGYRDAYVLLARELGLEDEVTLELIASAPGVIRAPGVPDDVSRIAASIEPALASALKDLVEMRQTEGAALKRELMKRLELAKGTISEIEAALPKANEERRARLEQRIAEALGDRVLDPTRIAQEVALLVDRADVTEELARLSSHVAQFAELLEAKEAVGRKLDFMLQEMHRESNTIGSKTANAQISQLVVVLKSELERTREQVQNVE